MNPREIKTYPAPEVFAFDESAKMDYLQSQFLILMMATRYGLWVINDLESEAKWNLKDQELDKQAINLRKDFGSYVLDIGCHYARLATLVPAETNIYPSDEDKIWRGINLPVNPLERAYTLWQERIGNRKNKQIDDYISQCQSFHENPLKSKEQYFDPIPPFFIRPWKLDRRNFVREEMSDLVWSHKGAIGESMIAGERPKLMDSRRTLTKFLKDKLPQGAHIMANMVSALPDAAFIAYWLKTKRQYIHPEVTLGFYQVSPIVESLPEGFHFPDSEKHFLAQAVKNGLPIVAVDGFASSGGTVYTTFKRMPPYIETVAEREGVKAPPFYFILTTSYPSLHYRIEAEIDNVESQLLTRKSGSTNISIFSRQF